MQSRLREIIDHLLEQEDPTRADLEQEKFKLARKYNLGRIPSNSELIRLLKGEERARLIPVLRRKATRALSGVNVVAVMTKPYPCPHGRCSYCPGGPDSDSPQSYTGHEPAAMRGSQNMFDPYMQVRSRVEQLEAIGHTVDKIDLIIMGGTFPATPIEYQHWFVKECLDAITGSRTGTLAEAMAEAESSRVRNVGITVETRPDRLTQPEIDSILGYGVTRVEVGVQNPSDELYAMVNRGHTVRDVVESTRRLKDSALKICYHMMPGMPGSSPARDLEAFKMIFSDPDYRPDMLKIYPTLVVKGTELYDWWRNGEYEPLETGEAVKLLADVKRIIPRWVRVMRIQRDIPLHQIEAGVDKSNLRQLVRDELDRHGERCGCIRCREVGHRQREGVQPDPERLEIIHDVYEASGGVEDFISVEDTASDILVGFLRLRMPSEEAQRPEITRETGLVREVHVYGEMTPVGALGTEWQHRGWGEALLAEAERVARDEYGMTRMAVMSALGTKEYYGRFGYRKDGVYVSKRL